MRTRTPAAFALLLTLALTGCDSGGEAPEAAPSTGTALTVLGRSADHLQTTSFTVEVTSGDAMRTTSRMDVPNKRAEMALKAAEGEQTMTVRTRLLGDETYMQIEGVQIPGVDERWMRIDAAKIPSGLEVGFAPGQYDAGAASRVLGAITSAERLPDGRYKGTLDLAKVGTGTGLSFSQRDLAGLGASAGAVPYLARLDAQGRLVHMQIDLPSITAGKAPLIESRYSAFGAPFQVEKPADATDPPDSVYKYFGG